jgi:hypothetical protein
MKIINIKGFLSAIAITIAIAATLLGSLFLLNNNKIKHYFNNRVLDNSTINSIKPIFKLDDGLNIKQKINLSRINFSNTNYENQKICISIWLSRPGSGTGTGSFDISLSTDTTLWAWTVQTESTEEHFKRYCSDDAPLLKDLIQSKSAYLEVTVNKEKEPNNGHIVLAPLGFGDPVLVNGQIQEGTTLPYRIEVQLPPTIYDLAKYSVLLVFSSLLALIFLHAFRSAWSNHSKLDDSSSGDSLTTSRNP